MKLPSTAPFVFDVHLLCFVRLMQELHVVLKFDWTHSLNSHFYIEVIAFFKENRRVVDWHTVMDWVYGYVILEYLRLDTVREVVIDWGAH